MTISRFAIVLLIISACATAPSKTTSQIIKEAQEYCKDVEVTDMRRGYCVWSQIQEICAADQSDAKICGEMSSR